MKRALFLIACSSGMRISTLLKLEPSDIDLEFNPPKITIPGGITKSGNPKVLFYEF
jgi:integrase